MERKRSNRRRRRGRFSFLWNPFCAAVAIAAMILALTFFFRMEHIEIIGTARYSEQEVLEASGLQTGGNLYFVNKFEVKRLLFERLPYLDEIRINRKLPDTLCIEVRECAAESAVRDGDGFWLLNGSGKVLEKTASLPDSCVLIRGAELIEPAATKQADFGEAFAYRVGVVLTLLREAELRGMRGRIVSVDLSDETALNMEYLYRFTVRIPWTSDVGYKLDTLETVANYLENNETGRIDLMTEGKASFIPQ